MYSPPTSPEIDENFTFPIMNQGPSSRMTERSRSIENNAYNSLSSRPSPSQFSPVNDNSLSRQTKFMNDILTDNSCNIENKRIEIEKSYFKTVFIIWITLIGMAILVGILIAIVNYYINN